MSTNAPSRSWRILFKISVRALMILVLLFGAGLGWIVHLMHTAGSQRESAAAIRRAGGDVSYEADLRPDRTGKIARPPHVRWFASRIGIDYVSNVVEVDLPRDLGDTELALASRFPRLERIWCCGSHDALTDKGLAHLDGLTNLRELDLSDAAITDAGLIYLKHLDRLQELDLSYTEITDAGLIHLSDLTSLEKLDLRRTRISDAGIIHLKKLNGLRMLDVRGTGARDFGAQELRRAIPNASVHFDGIDAR